MAKKPSSKNYVDALSRKYQQDMKFADDLGKRLPATPVSNRPVSQASASAGSNSDFIARQKMLMGDAATGEPASTGKSFLEKLSDPNSGPGKVIDVISQPMYALSQQFMEDRQMVKEHGWDSFFGIGEDGNKNKGLRNPLDSENNNFGTGNSKNTISDILRDSEFVDRDGDVKKTGISTLSANESDDNWNKAAKIAGSLALDIAGDPVSYIPPAAFATVAKVAGKGLTLPVKLAQTAEQGTKVRAVGDAAVKAGNAATEAAGKAAVKVAEAGDKFAATKVGKPVAATARGTGRVAGAILSPIATTVEAVQRGSVRKAARDLPDVVGEFSEAAARLSPEDATRVEKLLADAARKLDLEESVAESATRAGVSAEKATQETTEAVNDAAKINDGSFVPKVTEVSEYKAKTRTLEEVSGPIEQTLVRRGVKPNDTNQITYSETLAGLQRRTKGADDAEMYPGMSNATVKSPYYTPKRKTPTEAATEELTADVAAAAQKVEPEMPVQAIAEESVKATAKQAGASQKEMQAAVKALKGQNVMGQTVQTHYDIAHATSSDIRGILRKIKNSDGTVRYPKGKTITEEDILMERDVSQQVMGHLEKKIQAKRAAQAPASGAQNGGTEGLADVAPPPAAAPVTISDKLAEKADAVAKDSDVKNIASEKKPDARRLTGAALNSWKKKLVNEMGIHPSHVEELLTATSESAFKRKVTAMSKWKTDGPQYEVHQRVLKATIPDDVADVAEDAVLAVDQIAAGVAGEKTAASIAEESMTPMSSEAYEVLRYIVSDTAVTQNWAAIDPSMKWRTTIDQTLRNSKVAGEGYGVNRNSANAKFQTNAFQRAMTLASEQAKIHGLTGVARQKFLHTYTSTLLDEVFSKLKSVGIQPTIGYTPSGIPYSVVDLFNDLGKSSLGKNLLQGRVFDGFGVVKDGSFIKEIDGVPTRVRKVWGTNSAGERVASYVQAEEKFSPGTIKIDALLNSVKPLVSYLTDELSAFKTFEEAEKAINALIKKGIPKDIQKALRTTAGDLPIETLVKGIKKNGKPGYVNAKVPKEAAKNLQVQVAEALLDKNVMKSIYQTIQNNSAEAGIVFGQRVNTVNEAAIEATLKVLADPNQGTLSLAERLSPAGKKVTIEDAKKATGETNTTAQIDEAVSEKYEEALTEIVSKPDSDAAEYLVSIARAVEDGVRDTKGLDLIFASYKNAVSEGFHSQTAARLLSSGDNSITAMNSWISRIMQPLASRFINHWENPTLHVALLNQGNVGRVYQGIFRRNLNDISRKFGSPEGRTQLTEAFKMMQKGYPTAGTVYEEAANALRGPLDTMFYSGGLKESGGFTKFIDSGFDVDHVISRMEHGRNAMPEGFIFDKAAAKAAAKENGTTLSHELGKQWTNWDVKDPLEFMSRMNSILSSVATDSAIVMESVRIAEGLGRGSSRVRRAGFTRYVGEEGSIFAAYLPKDTYFDKEIIAEMKKMDEILSPTSRGSGKFAEFVDNVVSPITQHWKAGMTIYHAGHHVRNVIGDAAMSYLQDGVRNPKYYARASRMLAKSNIRRTYTAEDAMKALTGISDEMTGGGFAAKVKIRGKEVVLDDMQVQQLAMERGILPDFNVQEDVLDTARGEGFGAGFAKGANDVLSKPFKGKVREFAGSISEYRDDWVRMGHFMHVLEHHPRHLKTLDEVYDWAAARVRKAHPDGGDLTKFERNNMRLIFPFYSWSRKAIPLIVENMLVNPGRFMTYPKAMYAVAQANGMDLESLSVPFPEDEMLPSFLRDSMTGPLFHDSEGSMIGLDFGFPQADILNDFTGSQGPAGGFASMLNPLVKVPIELSTGSRMVAESKINDDAEYVESQIPGLAQLGQLTGYSPLKSAAGIARGEGPQKQASVLKGNKSAVGEGSGPFGFDPEAFVNRTVNFRYTDMSKPSYKTIAELEYRDEQTAARAKALKEMGR